MDICRRSSGEPILVKLVDANRATDLLGQNLAQPVVDGLQQARTKLDLTAKNALACRRCDDVDHQLRKRQTRLVQHDVRLKNVVCKERYIPYRAARQLRCRVWGDHVVETAAAQAYGNVSHE